MLTRIALIGLVSLALTGCAVARTGVKATTGAVKTTTKAVF